MYILVYYFVHLISLFFAMFCVVYTFVNMCATSLYLVNKLVTCCCSKFKNRLRSANWEEKFVSGSALHNFTEFYNTIKFLFDHTFIKEKIMIKYDNKNPWINKKLKADIVVRKITYNK